LDVAGLNFESGLTVCGGFQGIWGKLVISCGSFVVKTW
jgi:hypothetical protein